MYRGLSVIRKQEKIDVTFIYDKSGRCSRETVRVYKDTFYDHDRNLYIIFKVMFFAYFFISYTLQ